jgi:ATP-dependent Clp protease adapter protein ClpS
VKDARTMGRVRTEPPWKVVLHNDYNPINRVVWRLRRTIPGMTIKRATRIT